MKGMLKQPQQPQQRLIINTPIRTRDGSQQGTVPNRGQLTPSRMNKENQPALQSHALGGLSPSKINPTRKPALITKAQQQQYSTAPAPEIPQLRKTHSNKPNSNMLSSRRKECVNHPEKEAEYRKFVEGDILTYCYQCATHLMSQGFQLEKMVTLRQNSSRPSLPIAAVPEMEQSKPMRVSPAVQRHPRFHEVVEFTSQLQEVEDQLRRNEQAYSELTNHYTEQVELVQQFYDAMLSYIGHVKSNHLEILNKECRKFTQIGEIQMSDIGQALAELNEISKDIKDNVNDIVLKVTEEQYRDCLNFYGQKVQLYKHRVEDDTNTLQQVTEFQKDVLEGKLNQFKTTINDLLGVAEKGGPSVSNAPQEVNIHLYAGFASAPIHQQAAKAPPASSKQMFANMQKKPTQQHPQRPSLMSTTSPISVLQPNNHATSNPNPPFRNLFEQEQSMGEDGHLPDQSPQFKNM